MKKISLIAIALLSFVFLISLADVTSAQDRPDVITAEELPSTMVPDENPLAPIVDEAFDDHDISDAPVVDARRPVPNIVVDDVLDGPIIGAPQPWQLGLQPAVTPVKAEMIRFHNKILIPIIFGISIFVLILLLYVMIRFRRAKNPIPSTTSHNVKLEILWTLTPLLILLVIVIPSMRLLYFSDRVVDADMTIIATGYQWYWGYEYPDHDNIAFLSNMIPDDEIQEGQLRLLETDNRVVLPVNTNIRILVTAADVIHAFAVPALGVKIDAVPGQLNETWVRIEREGVYYGQCSELCGINHAYMPITIEAVSAEDFELWLETAREEFVAFPTSNQYALLTGAGE